MKFPLPLLLAALLLPAAGCLPRTVVNSPARTAPTATPEKPVCEWTGFTASDDTGAAPPPEQELQLRQVLETAGRDICEQLGASAAILRIAPSRLESPAEPAVTVAGDLYLSYPSRGVTPEPPAEDVLWREVASLQIYNRQCPWSGAISGTAWLYDAEGTCTSAELSATGLAVRLTDEKMIEMTHAGIRERIGGLTFLILDGGYAISGEGSATLRSPGRFVMSSPQH